MKTIVGIRFKEGGKVYYFDPGDREFEKGTHCIVETAYGTECGEVALSNREVPDAEIKTPLKSVRRQATEDDMRRLEENRQKEKRALRICAERIEKLGLEMSLVDAEYSFDRGKILFYFTADGRVDFRELVRDLAGIFKTRIELRQIGVRDESKMMGGLGVCGRPFCCHSFMADFHPVSIKMAKEQGLSLNPVKISGTCGRLMCCLEYEQGAYEQYWKRTPRVGSLVKTADGVGSVVDANVLKEEVRVKFVKGDDISFKIFRAADVEILQSAKGGDKGGKKKAERPAAKASEKTEA